MTPDHSLKNSYNNIYRYLDANWLARYKDFYTEEHFVQFNLNLKKRMNATEGDNTDALPFYQEEIKVDILETICNFKKIFSTQGETFEKKYATQLMSEPFENLLIVLGQRITAASVRDHNAIPPKKETLIKSCMKPYNEEMSIARRAREKHVGRGHTDFWGNISGNNARKEQHVLELIQYVIEHATWWNVFYHYKHELVYEIRIANGNGIRWNKEGTKLIGFLEPFLTS